MFGEKNLSLILLFTIIYANYGNLILYVYYITDFIALSSISIKSSIYELPTPSLKITIVSGYYLFVFKYDYKLKFNN